MDNPLDDAQKAIEQQKLADQARATVVRKEARDVAAQTTAEMLHAQRLYDIATKDMTDAERKAFGHILAGIPTQDAVGNVKTAEAILKEASDIWQSIAKAPAPKPSEPAPAPPAPRPAPAGSYDVYGQPNPLVNVSEEVSGQFGDAPLGNDDDYFALRERIFRGMTTMIKRTPTPDKRVE
jgi:hypothetical protein